MFRSLSVALLAALSFSASSLSGQPPRLTVKEEKAGLLKQAKITPEAALATAAAKVPGGTLKSAEIEREDGRLLFVFAFTKPGVKGEEEVTVDALSGALHKVEYESEADEAREAAADARTKSRKPAKPAAAAKPPVVTPAAR